MAFDIRQLDKLSYDDVEPLLEAYIHSAIQQFVNSDIGQEYVNTHPDGGFWIGTFIEFAYLYGEYTLSKLTKSAVQEVMEYTLPRKLTLLDPSDTDDAIDELIAFWKFLKQDYRLRSAGAIAKYLLSIKDRFPTWMFDPARSGISKNFMMQGMAAGYDMTTQEGAEAFQSEYNQNLKAGKQPSLMPQFPMTAPPPELQQVFDQAGIELPAVGEPVNPVEMLQGILQSLQQLAPKEELDDGPDDLLSSMRASLIQEALPDAPQISEEQSTLLHGQTITDDKPGSILHDFQVLLDAVGSEGIAVSGKRHQLPLKLLPDLNQSLNHPIDIDLKRPQQKSYSPLHGLYLLLRATGIVRVVPKSRKHLLVFNAPVYETWQTLNPTERYFTLLEAWLIRGDNAMLGEDRSGPLSEGDRVLRFWSQLVTVHKQAQSFRKYNDQYGLAYWPGLHNLALLEMFGFLKITSGKPSSGKGWRLRKIEALPLGNAVMTLMNQAYLNNNMSWQAERNDALPFHELQPVFQSYFPAWKESLAIPRPPFRAGRHIFKVSLGKIWRRIAISGEATLAALSGLILESVEFDSDHLDQFMFTNELGRKVTVVHPYAEGDFVTTEVTIGSLPLSEGGVMDYVFDFGDWWKFKVQLETVEPMGADKGGKKTKKAKNRRRSHQSVGEILERHGKSPEQYPDYDEAW